MLRLASIRPKAVKFPIRAEVILNSTVIPVALSNAFFDLGENKLQFFTGVFAYWVKRMLAAIADVVFIANIVNDTLTRNVG
jgi:hypothetical protein